MFASIPRRFSIATLFVVISLSAIACAVYGDHQRRLARQTRAFEQIAKRGGTIFHYVESVHIDFRTKPVGGYCGTGLLGVYVRQNPQRNFSDSDLHLLDDVITKCYVDFANSNVSAGAITEFAEFHPNCNVQR